MSGRSVPPTITIAEDSIIYFDVDELGNTFVHKAAATGNHVELAAALAKGVKADLENFMGWTPLMMATRNGHLKIVEMLIGNKVDASKKNMYGKYSRHDNLIYHIFRQLSLCDGHCKLTCKNTYCHYMII